MTSVEKYHIIRGKVFFYRWHGNRHWHIVGYLFGHYFKVWR
jgi:hypothetical protein